MTKTTRWTSVAGPALVATLTLFAVMLIATTSEAQVRRGYGGYFRWGLGAGGCADTTELCSDNVQTSFSPVDLELGYRASIIGFEGHLMLNPLTQLAETQGADPIEGLAWGLFGGLKLAPLKYGRSDPWIGLRAGFMQLTFGDDDVTQSAEGLGLGVVGGFDYFVTRGFAIGASAGYYSVNDENDGTHPVWTARASLVFYWELLSGSSSSKTKKKRARPKKRRKRPSY